MNKINIGAFTRVTLMGATMPLLAACGGGTDETDQLGNPPTSSNGYARGNSADQDGATISANPVLLRQNGNSASTVDFPLTVTVDAAGTVRSNYNGTPITLTQSADDPNRLETVIDGRTYRLHRNWESTQGDLALLWLNEYGNGPSYYGPLVAGINTSPDDVAGRSGTATYSGWGNIALARQDDGAFAVGEGVVTLNADFSAGTIDGNMAVREANSDTGYEIADTTVTIATSSIDGNAFDFDLALTPADFGLTSATTTGDGQFYEDGATAVGGALLGTGVDASDGGVVYIIGAFAAEE